MLDIVVIHCIVLYSTYVTYIAASQLTVVTLIYDQYNLIDHLPTVPDCVVLYELYTLWGLCVSL